MSKKSTNARIVHQTDDLLNHRNNFNPYRRHIRPRLKPI
nr:MAG TPA: hypothetical protein [Caudoviricetes sp.]DAT06959.1 MAG TPA: hypothetical protein [Caudoviricetes sp.]DAX38469.1 MAG TPA: hypothetical protein [Caudoviricetes sp.]